MNPETERQQLLFLWTGDSALTSRVVGWSFHDGNDLERDLPDLPFERGVDALAAGWRLLQASSLQTRPADDDLRTGVLEYEWLFERIVGRGAAEEIGGGTPPDGSNP